MSRALQGSLNRRGFLEFNQRLGERLLRHSKTWPAHSADVLSSAGMPGHNTLARMLSSDGAAHDPDLSSPKAVFDGTADAAVRVQGVIVAERPGGLQDRRGLPLRHGAQVALRDYLYGR